MTSTCCEDVTLLPSKRANETVPVQVDWHDYLANLREPGVAFAADAIVRPRRSEATGLQYRCTVAGIASGVPTGRLRWPKSLGATLIDGTVVWTAEAMAATSLRTTVSSDQWPSVTGLTISGPANADYVYQALIAGGVAGQSYDLTHQIVCANGEVAEREARLPVQD